MVTVKTREIKQLTQTKQNLINYYQNLMKWFSFTEKNESIIPTQYFEAIKVNEINSTFLTNDAGSQLIWGIVATIIFALFSFGIALISTIVGYYPLSVFLMTLFTASYIALALFLFSAVLQSFKRLMVGEKLIEFATYKIKVTTKNNKSVVFAQSHTRNGEPDDNLMQRKIILDHLANNNL